MRSLYRLTAVTMLIVLAMASVPGMGTTTASASTCDWAGFVADVTVPDGTVYQPGASFTKTWRLKNIGYCTWTTDYALVFYSGAQMGAPASAKFPKSVSPGQTVDLTLNMTAPSSAGNYFGYYKLKNAAGTIFGIGYTANKAFWVEINVAGSSGAVYDFTANAAAATWSSGAGTLAFPGTDGDSKGFGLKKDTPKFESGIESAKAGMLFAPQNLYNGYIQASYPAYKVQTGDRFQATIGCEYGATNCYVAYRLNYQIGNGAVRTYWTFRERYEGLTYNVDLNLNPLAGQDVKFILVISAYGSAYGDRALWGNPIIARAGGTVPSPTGPTPTDTATPTSTVPPSNCDKAQFISDVTIPDGKVIAAGTSFDKTWRLKNVGSCTWTTNYKLVFFSGEQMSGPTALTFPKQVAPGQTVDITVTLKAPTSNGTFRGYWMFKNANDALFGIGWQANKPWWVEIKVVDATTAAVQAPTSTATVEPSQTPEPSATPEPTNTSSQ